MKYLSVLGGGFLLCALLPLINGQAPDCDPAKCVLPNCRCSESGIPGGLNTNQIPQLVFLTFDEAVNAANIDFYQTVLANRKNPNNESITATFYVTHDHTSYPMVHELYRKGHEIALHSISGNYSQAYWQQLSLAGWRQEMVDQRTILANFANIPASAVTGGRAPQLQMGGELMYTALKQGNVKYDCSRPTEYFRSSGLWPYTNDYKSVQDCQITPCPKNSYPGFWTVPMINWHSTDNAQNTCSMADHCVIDGNLPQTSDDTFGLIKANFDQHYTNHRAPFGVFIRHGWVNGTGSPGDNSDAIKERRKGYERFLDYLDTLNDVYIVSVSRGIQWVQNPTPTQNLGNFAPFKVTELESQCTVPRQCTYLNLPPPIAGTRIMGSCKPCPPNYPWVGNPGGR